jgi:hypothetical protein
MRSVALDSTNRDPTLSRILMQPLADDFQVAGSSCKSMFWQRYFRAVSAQGLYPLYGSLPVHPTRMKGDTSKINNPTKRSLWTLLHFISG